GADNGGGIPIVAESLLRDVRDAGDFAFSGNEIFGLCGIRCLLACEIEEIHDSLKRVVDLVRDGGGDSAGGGELFCLEKGELEGFARGDVAKNFCGADDLTGVVANRRDAERDVEAPAILAETNGFEVINALACANSGEDDGLVAMQFLRDDGEDGGADHLLTGVSKDAGGGGIPTGDPAGEVLADDGIVGGFDD